MQPLCLSDCLKTSTKQRSQIKQTTQHLCWYWSRHCLWRLEMFFPRWVSLHQEHLDIDMSVPLVCKHITLLEILNPPANHTILSHLVQGDPSFPSCLLLMWHRPWSDRLRAAVAPYPPSFWLTKNFMNILEKYFPTRENIIEIIFKQWSAHQSSTWWCGFLLVKLLAWFYSTKPFTWEAVGLSVSVRVQTDSSWPVAPDPGRSAAWQ